MTWVAVGVAGVGAAASIGGGILGGQSASRNARRQREEQARREAQFRLDAQNQNRLADVYGQDSEGLAMGGRDAAAANLQRIFGRNLQAANQLSRASMAGLGYNSLLPNQLSANARRSAEQESGALSDLDQRFLDRRLAIRGQINADRQNRFSNQNALQQGYNGQAVSLLGAQPGSTTGSLLQGFGGFLSSGAVTPLLQRGFSALGGGGGGGGLQLDVDLANRLRDAAGSSPAPVNPYGQNRE